VIKELSRQLVQWPFLVILAASISLALLIPPRFISTMPGIDTLLRAVTNAVPATGEFIQHSRFPEIAAVYFPLMLVLSPLHFLWTWRIASRTVWTIQFANTPIKASFKLLVALALTALTAFGTFAVGGGQLEVIPWNESKVALALAGYVESGGGFFIALAAFVLGCEGLVKGLRKAPPTNADHQPSNQE